MQVKCQSDPDSTQEKYRLHSVSEDGSVKIFISNTKPTQAEIDELYNAMILINKLLLKKPRDNI